MPASVKVPGWFSPGPSPGQVGSAVILGHVDSYQGPGVFFQLRTLQPGNQITVNLADGVVATFKVTSVVMYQKTQFPDQQVYGSNGSSELPVGHLRRDVRLPDWPLPLEHRRLLIVRERHIDEGFGWRFSFRRGSVPPLRHPVPPSTARSLPASSWNPMKFSTRQDATASVGDHEVPPSAAATSFIRVGTASFCVSAFASSWATRARLGEPAKTVNSCPPSPVGAAGACARHRGAVCRRIAHAPAPVRARVDPGRLHLSHQRCGGRVCSGVTAGASGSRHGRGCRRHGGRGRQPRRRRRRCRCRGDWSGQRCRDDGGWDLLRCRCRCRGHGLVHRVVLPAPRCVNNMHGGRRGVSGCRSSFGPSAARGAHGHSPGGQRYRHHPDNSPATAPRAHRPRCRRRLGSTVPHDRHLRMLPIGAGSCGVQPCVEE